MKLIKFTRDSDYGQDLYVQVLFNKRWALLQTSVHWFECPVWPFLQIQSGMGNLISILFSVYKFGFNIGLLERTWRF
jgi:hypothetical protein